MGSTYCRSCPPDAKSCGAKNADGLWCTREHGHPPPHVACSEKHEVATWGAPIDPVLVTLAAAALGGLLAADRDRVVGYDQAAHEAFKHALVTRAALREAGEGETK